MKLKRTAAAVVAAVMAFTAVATPLGDNIPALEGAFSAGAYYSVKDSFYPVALTGDGAVDMVNVAVAQAGRKDDDDGWYPSREAWCADFVLDVARVAGQTVAVPDAPANAACGTFKNALLNAGAKEVETAQAGDLVFYCSTSGDTTYHVGIMKDSRYSVEGNALLNGVFQVVDNRDTMTYTTTKGLSIANGDIKRVFIRPNYVTSITHPDINIDYITKEQGAQWALDRVGQSIDVDGYYGAQCKDFVEKFTTENFGVSFPGNAIDLIYCTIPSGWQRIKNTPEFLPQPGDIALWAYGTYGHTGIIVSANLNTFVSVDQNWYNASSNGSPAAKVQHNYTTYNFWGVLRPPYSSNPQPNQETWKVNVSQGVNVRSGPGTNYGVVKAYPNGTTVTITEKTSSGGYTWGKCGDGWLVLDYCQYLSGSLQHTHSYGAWYDKTKPTCTSAGVQEQKCSCGATKTRETAALGHSWGGWATATKPTCTAQGVEQRTCSRCSKAETRYITALGHNYSSEWTIDKQATCSAEGSKSKHCTRCSSVTEVTAIPKTAHSYKTTVVAPTLTSQGYTVHECTVCHYSYKDSYTSQITLPAVTGVKVKTQGSTSLTLAWDKNSSANGYVVEQYSGGKWTQIAKSFGNDIVDYTVKDLKADTLYTFRIKGYVVSGTTEYSGEYTRLAAKTRIANVGTFKGSTVSDSAVKLDWSKNDKATGYVIEQYKGGKWTALATTKNNTTLTFTVKGLASATVYSFRIKSFRKAGGKIEYSEYASLKAATSFGGVNSLTVKSYTASAITLAWSKNASANGYIIEQYKGGKWVQIAKTASNAVVSYTVSGLAADTTYTFRVRAYKTAAGKTIYSEYARLAAKTRIAKVATFTGSAVSASAVKLDWRKNDKATGYVIEQYKGGKWTVIATTKNNTTLKFTVKGLKNDTTYSFRIRAYKTVGGVTAYSDYVRIAGKTRIPNVAKFTGSAVSASAVKLDWSKNDKATGYVIEQYKSGKWTVLATTKNNTTLTFTVKGLAEGTAYSFRIKSFRKTGGTTEFSEYASVKAATAK